MWGCGLILAAVLGAASGPEQLLAGYRGAWDRADAKALAGFYAADGELQTPYGVRAEGPQAIAAFYEAAFQRGYAGSRGEAELRQVKALSPYLVLGRGVWSIRGARGEAGPRAAECGEFVMVARRQTGSGNWRIVALHELAGICPAPG
jgi:uncharacterized protein (TIGR02246 family)